jgi:TPR repeat protein/uncharacterized membrane protein YciS (DUF1049 family)
MLSFSFLLAYAFFCLSWLKETFFTTLKPMRFVLQLILLVTVLISSVSSTRTLKRRTKDGNDELSSSPVKTSKRYEKDLLKRLKHVVEKQKGKPKDPLTSETQSAKETLQVPALKAELHSLPVLPDLKQPSEPIVPLLNDLRRSDIVDIISVKLGRAAYKEGKKCYVGIGVPRDYYKAFKWFEIAAKHGNDKALKMLGYLYFKGRGTNLDYIKAYNYFLESSKCGNEEAHSYVGMCLLFGKGVTQDEETAFKWLITAANCDVHVAQIMVALMYSKGIGVQKNEEMASYWNKISKVAINPDQFGVEIDIKLDKDIENQLKIGLKEELDEELDEELKEEEKVEETEQVKVKYEKARDREKKVNGREKTGKGGKGKDKITKVRNQIDPAASKSKGEETMDFAKLLIDLRNDLN